MTILVPHPRRVGAGTHLELLVLVAGRTMCAGVDLGTGALVRARYDADHAVPVLEPYDTAVATVSDDDVTEDPSCPEAVELAAPPRRSGRLRRRQAERWIRPLLHPKGQPLLGFAGPAIPFWTLRGERPSLAVVAPESAPAVVADDEGAPRCRFRWQRRQHDLPFGGSALLRPSRRARLVVTLSPPRDGHCYKVVAGLL